MKRSGGISRPKTQKKNRLARPARWLSPSRGNALDIFQVNERAGISFASALRTFLRQDPDIILVGEVRDAETAEIATHAALTGHLVLTTLHTNDALGAIPRMIELGVEGSILRSSISAIMAQRLVRKLCCHCRQNHRIKPEEREIFEQAGMTSPEKIHTANSQGCPACRAGYSGATILYEVLYVTPAIRDAIGCQLPPSEMKRLAQEAGLVSMAETGLRKVAIGEIDFSELSKFSGVARSGR